MAAKWIELVTGSLEQKKQYAPAAERYRAAAGLTDIITLSKPTRYVRSEFLMSKSPVSMTLAGRPRKTRCKPFIVIAQTLQIKLTPDFQHI